MEFEKMITTITITHENSDFISLNKKNIDDQDQILLGHYFL